METISLDKALQIMERVDGKGKPVPFIITVATCDLNRNTGGERITCTATLCSPNGKRKAYHHRNDTRNIKRPNAEYPFAIHPLLILKINGKTVYL